MIEKRTILNQRTLLRDGTVLIQFLKQVVEDGEVIHEEPHRVSIEPGIDPDFVFSEVDKHLGRLKCAPIEESCKPLIRKHVAEEHTAERVAAQRAKVMAVIQRQKGDLVINAITAPTR